MKNSPVSGSAITHDPNELESRSTAALIRTVCSEVAEFLINKNLAYGDSALNPLRIFSKADPIEQIHVRMDDKLSRLARGKADQEDTKKDLLGYLVLEEVAKRKQRLANPSVDKS